MGNCALLASRAVFIVYVAVAVVLVSKKFSLITQWLNDSSIMTQWLCTIQIYKFDMIIFLLTNSLLLYILFTIFLSILVVIYILNKIYYYKELITDIKFKPRTYMIYLNYLSAEECSIIFDISLSRNSRTL